MQMPFKWYLIEIYLDSNCEERSNLNILFLRAIIMAKKEKGEIHVVLQQLYKIKIHNLK